MVLLLVFDVLDQTVLRLYRFRKCTIPILPTLEIRKDFFTLDEVISGEFDVLDQTCDGYCRVNVRQNMEMIFHTIDSIEVAVFVGEQVMNIGKQPFLLVRDNCFLTMFRRKNHMVDQLRVGAHTKLIWLGEISVIL